MAKNVKKVKVEDKKVDIILVDGEKEEVKEKPWSELTSQEKKERREKQRLEKEAKEKAAIERAMKKAAEEKAAKLKRIAEHKDAMEVKALIDDTTAAYKDDCAALSGKIVKAVEAFWEHNHKEFGYTPNDDVYAVFSIIDNPYYGHGSFRRKISLPCVKFMSHYFRSLEDEHFINEKAALYAKMSGNTVIIEKITISQLYAVVTKAHISPLSLGNWYDHLPGSPYSQLRKENFRKSA